MTYSTNVPNANQSPGSFPAQASTNWTRLKALIGGDHLFNNTSDTDDGYHKVVHWVNQSGALGDNDPAPVAGVGQGYTKTLTTKGLPASTAGSGEHLMYQRGTDGSALQEASLSVCPVRAAANFVGRTSNGDCTLQWSYNVDTIARTAAGKYRVNFEVDMPSSYYIPVFSAMPSSTRVIPVIHSATYSTTFDPSFFLLDFFRATNADPQDPQYATIVIYGG